MIGELLEGRAPDPCYGRRVAGFDGCACVNRDPLTGSGHSQTVYVPCSWQIPPEGRHWWRRFLSRPGWLRAGRGTEPVPVAAEAPGCEASGVAACDAVPEPEVGDAPQAATMMAAAHKAAHPPVVAIARATRCTGAMRIPYGQYMWAVR